MGDHIAELVLLLMSFFTTEAINYTITKCPTGGTPILHMCQGGSVTQESVLLDFFYANDASVVKCKCTVLIVAGKQFTFSEISSPGYNGCGSEITISRDNLGNEDTHRISCLGGTTYSGLIAGETLSIELHKKMEPMDTRYCYRLDIRNAPHPSMTVTCIEETTTTSTTTTTTLATTTFLATTTLLETTGEDTTERTTTEATTTSTTPKATTAPSTEEVTTKTTTAAKVIGPYQCPADSDFLVGILGALTGITLLYSVVITVLYFRRKPPPVPQQPNQYAEVYEEIPAYVSPVTSRGSQNRALPKIPTVNDSKKPPKPPSSKIPSLHYKNQYQSEGSFIRHINGNNSSHWNWTYDEKTEQERERERTEYLMAF